MDEAAELPSELTNILHRLQGMLDNGDFPKLIQEARSLMGSSMSEDARSIAAAFLINGGDLAGDLDAVDEGISGFEAFISAKDFQLDEQAECSIRYNISHGYGVRCRILSQKDDAAAFEARQTEKETLQGILLRKGQVSPDVLPAVLTNYAHLLDESGRSFEAVDYYSECLLLDPKHGMAKGQCAAALRKIADLSNQHRVNNVLHC